MEININNIKDLDKETIIEEYLLLDSTIKKLSKITELIASGYHFNYYPDEEKFPPDTPIGNLVKNFNKMIKKVIQNESMLKEQVQEKLEEIIKFRGMQFRMSPHYLYNSLNSINAILQKNQKNASRALILLSNNYRFMTEISNSELISLKDEWEFTENYLELEKLKYKNKLVVKMKRPNKLPNVYIPPYTIQPIVENSFKHGFNSNNINCQIMIECIEIEFGAQINFEDNGAGTKGSIHLERSIGNIIERLEFFYKNVSLKIDDRNDSGVKIQLSFYKRRLVK